MTALDLCLSGTTVP